MASLLRNKHGNYIFYGLMALLVVGLGGFGIRNFSTGGGITTAGTVGGQQITANDYARALRQELAAASKQMGQQLTMEQAQQLGIDKSVMGQLFTGAALDDEAQRFGLSVGDDQVMKRLSAFQAFQGVDGKFDRDAYKFQLQQQGMTVTEFEQKIRAETARTVLQGAVVNGVAAPATYVKTLTDWAGEARSFTIAALLPSDLTDAVPNPTDAQIKAYYDAHPDAFTRPETRNLTTLWLSPEMLSDKATVDDAALHKAYDARKAEFIIPERRLVDRLVFPTEDDAKAAKARIDAGTATFEDIVKERGLTLDDVTLGEQSKEALGAAGDGVFALAQPGVAGPLTSDLGPALFAMNGILAADETTFDEARDELSGEAKLDTARRMIQDQTAAIEDALASGAKLEDVAKEQGMQLDKLAFNTETEGGLAGYPAFREKAAAIKADDFPELVGLDDGGVFAIRLDSIDPPAVKPLDDVRDAVAAAWTKDETHARLVARAAEFAAAVANGASLESLGLVTTRYDHLTRGGFIADVPKDVGKEVFKMAKGKASVVDSEGQVVVIALSDIHPVDRATDEVKKLEGQIDAQAAQGVSQDIFELYAQSVRDKAGVTVDQAVLNAVNTQIVR